MRALPNLAALIVLIGHAATVDEYHALQPEPPSYHVATGLLLAVLAWGVLRAIVWAWGR